MPDGVLRQQRQAMTGAFCSGRPIAMITRCGCAAIALLAVSPARAAPLPDAQRVITYSVVDQSLRDVLAGIGQQLNLRTEISSHVHGQVHGRLPPATAREMLDRLAALYEFDWYYDDRTLFVSGWDEAVSKVLPLGSVGAGELRRTLRQLGVSDDRWPVRVADASGVAAVNGPPHYAGLVDQTLVALAQGAKASETQVHVFRGTAAGQ
jgi:type II secretory pathway component GspD/PulD (secretin)